MAITYIEANNIISSLGFTTEENMQKVYAGISGLTLQKENSLGVPEPFVASLVQQSVIDNSFSKISAETKLFTRFEKLAILSVYNASQNCMVNLANDRTIFVLSTTKGNVGLLMDGNESGIQNEQIFLWHSANVINKFFKNPNHPVVISNACISGISAQIVAKRILNTGLYDHAVVVGCDELTKFIVSGFQSFKALSGVPCKPFDINRSGLNLGEGAATIILGVTMDESQLPVGSIILEDGAITNDANHISGPSRIGEGLFLALESVCKHRTPEEIGFINAHGTATSFNDEMESIALYRSNLTKVPVNSLKGYFGHTLGASGLLESIVSCESLQNDQFIKSLGYECCGVSNPLAMITKEDSKPMSRCLKMASGFGGCNAVILFKKVL